MGRSPCCDKTKVRKGTWTPEEDDILKNYIEKHGTGGNWISLPQKAGLNRCGKSCRLRWLNYLRPDIKHGDFTDEEDRIICNLYYNIGSRWSIIASNLVGRTDNDVKNYWNTKLKKKILAGKITNVKIVQNSPPISRHEQQYINYANSASSSSNVTNSITFPNHMLMQTPFHHQQNFNPISLPHPNPMEFSDFGFSSSQEVSSISNSPSLGLDNSYGWSSSGGGGGGSSGGAEPDQILEDFDFEWAYGVLNNGIGFPEKIEEEAGLNYSLNNFYFTS